MMATLNSERFEALVIFKTVTNSDIGVLWIPKLVVQRDCPGLSRYKLGQWVMYDNGTKSVVNLLKNQPYETQLFEADNQRDIFVQVKVPAVYFSEKQHNQVLAFSPGFGRVGSFFKQPDLIMDTLYHAWIAFMGYYQDNNWQKLMIGLDVKWVVVNLIRPFNKQEMISAKASNQFDLCRGIVISTEEDPEYDLTLLVKFWNANYKICHFRVNKTQKQQTKEFLIGNWYCFMPVQNWSREYCAISPFVEKIPTGISLVEYEPLKVKISHEFYKLDQDPAANCVHIPGWFGTIPGTSTFIQEFRKARLQRPHQSPRLFVEFNGYDSWRPIYFDGYKDSPPPTPREQQKEHLLVIKEKKFIDGFKCPCSSQTSKAILTMANELRNQKINKDEVHNITDDGCDTTISIDHLSRPPSVSSDFEQTNAKKEDFLGELDRTTSTTKANYSRKQGSFGSRYQQKEHYPANTNVKSTYVAKRQNRNQILPLKREKKLSGLVVSIAENDDGFYIYTPEYPDKEIFLHRSSSYITNNCDLKHGSWLTFTLCDDEGQLTITELTLDNAPFETITTRNTVQIKILAFVPRIWRPQMPNHKGIVDTEFVSQVVDVKQLIEPECAEQQLRVLIERVKDNNTGKITWQIEKIFD